MIFTNAKRNYLIRHFGIKMSPATRHTQRQDVLGVKDSRVKLSGVKLVASSCPASKKLCMKNILY